MFARFERKHFRWSDAVSFLSQFTQNTKIYVQHNGHLTYEVWALHSRPPFHGRRERKRESPEARRLVAKKPELRDARSLHLKKNKNYKRVEKCSPNEFLPSLTAFDQMLNSLVVQ